VNRYTGAAGQRPEAISEWHDNATHDNAATDRDIAPARFSREPARSQKNLDPGLRVQGNPEDQVSVSDRSVDRSWIASARTGISGSLSVDLSARYSWKLLEPLKLLIGKW